MSLWRHKCLKLMNDNRSFCIHKYSQLLTPGWIRTRSGLVELQFDIVYDARSRNSLDRTRKGCAVCYVVSVTSKCLWDVLSYYPAAKEDHRSKRDCTYNVIRKFRSAETQRGTDKGPLLVVSQQPDKYIDLFVANMLTLSIAHYWIFKITLHQYICLNGIYTHQCKWPTDAPGFSSLRNVSNYFNTDDNLFKNFSN